MHTVAFDDVAPQCDSNTCVCCRKTFARQDRIRFVNIVGGIGPHPSSAGRCVYICQTNEFAHIDCVERTLARKIKEVQRRRLRMAKVLPLRAKVPDYQCSRCGKVFERGDRVGMVFLVEGLVKDPQTQFAAVQCSAEHEVVHIDCRDPQLHGSTTTGRPLIEVIS